jgi:hypothetical protein
MSLGEHYSESNYLGEGDHLVTVTSFDTFECTSGTEGVEFTMTDAKGRTTKCSFLTLPQCQWILASFAAACGMTKEQMDAYYPERGGHHVMLNRQVVVGVIKRTSGKGTTYHEVDKDSKAWWKADDRQPTAETPPTQPGERFVAPVGDDDDIPF